MAAHDAISLQVRSLDRTLTSPESVFRPVAKTFIFDEQQETWQKEGLIQHFLSG